MYVIQAILLRRVEMYGSHLKSRVVAQRLLYLKVTLQCVRRLQLIPNANSDSLKGLMWKQSAVNMRCISRGNLYNAKQINNCPYGFKRTTTKLFLQEFAQCPKLNSRGSLPAHWDFRYMDANCATWCVKNSLISRFRFLRCPRSIEIPKGFIYHTKS